MIDLEIPKRLRSLVTQGHLIAANAFRPISRKYDTAEHSYPKELDMVAALLDGVAEGGAGASVNDLESGTKSDKPRFVNQRRSLKGLPRRLVGHSNGGELPQILVNQRQ